MKLALLGDIHGNHIALEAALRAARNHAVEKLLITGDLVGYYFWPGEVLEMLSDWDYCVVRGNHEQMLVDVCQNPELLQKIDDRYGSGLRVALERLSSTQLDWLMALPHPLEVEVGGRSFLLCHGSPWDLDFYLYPDAEAKLLQRCAESGHDWVVLGHTHYPMKHEMGNVGIVNPGSVGQPRNRCPGAHWALLDTISNELSFMIEDYDAAGIIHAARQLEPNVPYLHQVLTRQ